MDDRFKWTLLAMNKFIFFDFLVCCFFFFLFFLIWIYSRSTDRSHNIKWEQTKINSIQIKWNGNMPIAFYLRRLFFHFLGGCDRFGWRFSASGVSDESICIVAIIQSQEFLFAAYKVNNLWCNSVGEQKKMTCKWEAPIIRYP